MDLINQHNAWTASEISAGVGIAGLIVAIISNREKVWDFFKKHWYVIVVVFTLMGLWSLYELAVALLTRLWREMENLSGFRIPLWGVFAAIMAVFSLRWIFPLIAKWFKRNNKQSDTTVSPQQTVSPRDFQDEDFWEDLIDGVWWQWTYSGNRVGIPRPICPNRHCQCDLDFRQDYERANRYGYLVERVPVSLHCERCGFNMNFDKTKSEVLNSVSKEIIRLLRTGQFRYILARRAANQ